MLGARAVPAVPKLHAPLLRPAWRPLLVFVDVMKELPATLVLRGLFGGDTRWPWWRSTWRATNAWASPLPALHIVAVGLLPVVLLSRALRVGESVQKLSLRAGRGGTAKRY